MLKQLSCALVTSMMALVCQAALAQSYTIVDTGQTTFYNNTTTMAPPTDGNAFYGQDAQYSGNQASYINNADGTISDLNTGLMWQQTPQEKMTWAVALTTASTIQTASYNDWRLPTIKELYSLIDFNGSSPVATPVPYIDTNYFDFEYGNEAIDERLIDAQYWSNTAYVGTTMNNDPTTFGVNFADGRIKGYGTIRGDGSEMTQFVRYVRGNTDYGINNFANNGDGTITDSATGLMWMQADNGAATSWQDALADAENMQFSGYDDWRLPNAKELQSIVDYTRAPDATDPAQQSAAIDPIFDITDSESYFWTSTTHLESGSGDGSQAAYIAFGMAMGWMEQPPGSGNYNFIDVHGAGAQRSDPKTGDPVDYPLGHGPQGDDIRIYNFSRLVRDVQTPSVPEPASVILWGAGVLCCLGRGKQRGTGYFIRTGAETVSDTVNSGYR